MSDKAQAPVGAELKDAIKRQVEFYFSRANLANDAFLVSQMNSQMYVPIEVILNFSKIQQLTDNAQLLVEAIADSTVCSLNETKDAVKPNIKSERTTIILREIPSATKPEEVEAIFEGCGKVASVRSDVGDTWFVTMHSESEAVSTLLALRSKSFNGAPIKARLKSENVLKSFYPAQPAENAMAPAMGTPYGGRGYYAQANMGYYDNYGVQYNTVNPRAGQQHPQQQFNGAQRGANGGRGGQNFRANRANGANAANQHGHQQKDARAKSGTEQRSNSRKNKDKRAKNASQTGGKDKEKDKRPASSASAERQPILNALNFPPLPTAAEAAATAVITHSYTHEDIMEIVKNMDEKDCTLPEGKMDYEAHPAALTSVAHPDLLRNQRTYSIEQARDAMRQGRPIRSDSVGSIDYESMMYGEDYTKEARELRKKTAAEETAAKPAATGAKTSASASTSPKEAKAVGYAAAVINGTPALAPTAPDAKKKQSTTKTSTVATKDEKKPVAKKPTEKATESAVEKAATPVVEETLPKTGAWGGRNFLDVVKADPPAAPVKVASSTDAKSVASASESN